MDAHLSGLSARQQRAALVDDRDLDAGSAPNRSRHARVRRQRVRRHLVARLGHAVGLEHRDAQAVLHPRHQVRRERRAAGAHKAQPFGPGGTVFLGAHQDQLVRCGRGGEPGRPRLPRRRPEHHGRESPRNRHRAAGRQRRERRRHQAVNMEERHRAQRDILGPEAVRLDDVRDRCGQVAMPQGHPLRPAGRTTGVQDEGDVVGLRRRDAAYLASRAIALEQ